MKTENGGDNMQGDEQNQSRKVDKHMNQDKVLKESLDLYTGGSLEFLDSGVYEGVHKEWEADISEPDMKRFASSNIDLSRNHNMDFTTVIITAKKPRVTSYKNKSLTFTPKIIDLSARDADAVLAEIDRKLKAGKKFVNIAYKYIHRGFRF